MARILNLEPGVTFMQGCVFFWRWRKYRCTFHDYDRSCMIHYSVQSLHKRRSYNNDIYTRTYRDYGWGWVRCLLCAEKGNPKPRALSCSLIHITSLQWKAMELSSNCEYMLGLSNCYNRSACSNIMASTGTGHDIPSQPGQGVLAASVHRLGPTCPVYSAVVRPLFLEHQLYI